MNKLYNHISSITIVFMVVVLSSLITSCGGSKKPTNTSTSGLAKVMCDESFENILNQEIDVFEYTYPNASIMPFYVSESAAIDSLINFKTGLIIITRDLPKEQVEYIKKKNGMCYSQRIAVDAIALIVNKNNPIDSLSMSELHELLSGSATTWKQLNNGTNDTVKIVFDNAGSSTARYMREKILGGKPFTSHVYAQKSNPNVFKTVRDNKNAIGIIGVSWLSDDMKGDQAIDETSVENLSKEDTTATDFNSEVKVLKIYKDGAKKAFKPYQAYIYDGSYPLYRNIYAICASPRGSLSHGFFSFLTGFVGQKIIMKTGILPSIIPTRVININ